ncbi:MAG: hypothetical protein FWC27_04055 [Firmicutes bacterium]|nr:hypothetical protein [Bacillota bacterium]
MRGEKKKGKPFAPLGDAPLRAPVPVPPKLPAVERAFFEMLLEALGAGLQESEKDLRKPAGRGELLRKNSRLRGTVAYARALLRLEEFDHAEQPAETEQAEIAALLNVAVNNLRRSFLYAGVAVRRPANEPAFAPRAPKGLALFLLEEMLACCLRCAPEGRNLYINTRPIGGLLLLSMRTEGPPLQQSPLIPLLEGDGGAAPEEDCGFAVCRVLAARLGWAFRWEADEAGVRMFLDIRP